MNVDERRWVIVFLYLQILDVLSTLIGFSLGNTEASPFVRRVFLPNCLLVGPLHTVNDIGPDLRITVCDDHRYEDREISDEEFCRLRNEAAVQG